VKFEKVRDQVFWLKAVVIDCQDAHSRVVGLDGRDRRGDVHVPEERFSFPHLSALLSL
jgi:hypothetical protein